MTTETERPEKRPKLDSSSDFELADDFQDSEEDLQLNDSDFDDLDLDDDTAIPFDLPKVKTFKVLKINEFEKSIITTTWVKILLLGQWELNGLGVGDR